MNRRQERYQMVRQRAYHNMRAVRARGKKENFLKGIGEGVVFLLLGAGLFALTLLNITSSSLLTILQQIPWWIWLIGGGMGVFGLYWILRNIWLLVSPGKEKEKIQAGE